jgi:hypothetical protein
VLVFRTIYGPLDKKQRVITAGVKLFKNQKNKATLEILKDPQKMYKFKQLDRLSATNFAGIALLTENMLGDKAKDLYTQDDVDYWNSKGDPETAQWISNYMEASAKIRGIREGVYKPPPEGQKPPPYRPVGGGTAMDRERASRGVR